MGVAWWDGSQPALLIQGCGERELLLAWRGW